MMSTTKNFVLAQSNRESGIRNPISPSNNWYCSYSGWHKNFDVGGQIMLPDCANILEFNKNGTHCLGATHYDIYIWDWLARKPLKKVNQNLGTIFDATFLDLSSSDINVLSSSQSGIKHIHIGPNEINIKIIFEEYSENLKLAANNVEPHVFLSLASNFVYRHDLRTNKKPEKILKLYTRLDHIEINPVRYDEFCVSGMTNQSHILVYDQRCIKQQMEIYSPHAEDINPRLIAAKFSKDGNEILGTYTDCIFLYKRHTPGVPYRKYIGIENRLNESNATFIGEECKYITCGSDDGVLRIWKKDNEQPFRVLRCPDDGYAFCIASHPKTPLLFTSGLENHVDMWVPQSFISNTPHVYNI